MKGGGGRGGHVLEIYAKGDILHGEIRSEQSGLQGFLDSLGWCSHRCIFGLVFLEVRWCYPAVLVIFVFVFVFIFLVVILNRSPWDRILLCLLQV